MTLDLDLNAIVERAKRVLRDAAWADRLTWAAAAISSAEDVLALAEEVRLLRAVAEAAHAAVILEYDPQRHEEINQELGRRAADLRQALAILSREPAEEAR